MSQSRYETTIAADRAAASDGFIDGLFLGQVGTRCQTPDTVSTGNTTMECLSYHVMRDTVSRFKLVFSWGYIDSQTLESGLGADASIAAYVVAPGGARTQVKFNKAVLGVIPDLGHLESDWIDVPLATGDLFGVDAWVSCSAGVAYNNYKQCAGMGDKFAMGAAVANNTATGVWTSTDTSKCFMPSGIIAQTFRASAIIIGDSRAHGANQGDNVNNDTPDSATNGDTGTVERSLGPNMGYINVARQGDQLQMFRASYKWRTALAKYCTAAIVEYGINDLSNSRTASQLAADRNAVPKLLPPTMPIWLMTMTPLTATTDNWATTGNQSIGSAGRETNRETENTARRAVPAGFAGCFDVASVVETAISGGKGWIVNGSAYYATGDGTHETKAANEVIKAANVIDATLLARTPTPKFDQPTQRYLGVKTRTSGKTLVPEDAGTYWSNEGASALNSYTMPPAIKGLGPFRFVVQDADGIKVIPASGDTIRVAASVSTAGSSGYVQSTAAGSMLELIAINATEWLATYATGTWTTA